MRLIRLRGSCPDTESCPTLYSTDRGTAVLQGYLITEPETLAALTPAGGEAVIEVPQVLFKGLTISGPTLYSTAHDTVLVRGATVTDPEALTMLRLLAGEAAVEVPLSLLIGLTT